MSKPNAGQQGNTDSWSDNDTHASVSSAAKPTGSGSSTGRKAKTAHIPDDWDDDEDEDEDTVENNERVWEDANSRSPMPQVVISTTSSHSTSGFGSNPPPPEALSGPLRILKRPKDASAASLSRSSSGASTNSQLTLVEREAIYQAARERIFSGQSQASGPSPAPASAQNAPRISRNPRGPDSSNIPGEPSRGFEAQRRKNPETQPK